MAFSLLCCATSRPKGQSARGTSAPRHGADFSPSTFEKIGTTFDDDDEAPSSKNAEKLDDKARMAKLDALAEKLTRTIRKYPKSSRSFMRAPKERFMAALPAANSDSKNTLARWKQGYLAYWETEEDFRNRTKPKGYIALMRIAKVQHLTSQYDGCGVTIKHKPDHDFQEMVILLQSLNEAREFCYVLWDFLGKLRGEWDDKHPDPSY